MHTNACMHTCSYVHSHTFAHPWLDANRAYSSNLLTAGASEATQNLNFPHSGTKYTTVTL